MLPPIAKCHISAQSVAAINGVDPPGRRAPDWGRWLRGPSGQLVPPSRQTESQLGSGFRSVCGGVIVMMMSICAGINNRGSPKLCLQLYTTRATSLIDVASCSQTLGCCNQCFLLSPLPLPTIQQLSLGLPCLLQRGLLLLFKHIRIIYRIVHTHAVAIRILSDLCYHFFP